ncbi:single-stranded DNA-binding protein [Haloimpatiens sp. FM7315]|uniref:single-stranded DNA-binding protein n=1 Tax=Haloimpatiens sp. FM7315 TaxID=3298609 RepID=UPI0035A39A27
MNKILLIGRLVRDPEVIKTNEGKMFSKFTIAINNYKGSKEKTVDYVPVITFSKTSEYASKYLKKGMLVSLVGRISTGNYETKDGEKKYYIDVIANEVQILSSASKKEIKEA